MTLFLAITAGMLAAPGLAPSAHAATVSDNFNRADGGLGANWTTVTGTTAPKIVSHSVRPGTAGKLNSAYWSAATFSGNQYVQASLPNSSGSSFGPGVAVRLSGATGYFLWYGNSANTVSLWRMDSSSNWTQLAQSAALTISATDVWRLEASGSGLTGYQNGKSVVQATDTHYTTGSPGVWLYYATNQITNWSAGDLSTTAPPATFSVGGSVSGLSGTLVLQDSNAGSLTITANGAFTFPTQLTTGTSYNATIQSSPATQTCTTTNGAGTIGTANVTNITVTCTTTVSSTYSLGGSVSGLSGTLVLQDSNAGSLTITANGAFTFPTQLTTGTSYNATIQSSPATQTCTTTNGAGTIGTANVTNITVTCTTAAPPPTAGSATDDFNRANGPLGGNWTDMAEGGLAISSQAVAGTSASGNSGDIFTGQSYGSDQYSSVQLTSTSLTGNQWIGPAVRAQSGGATLYLGIYFFRNGSPLLMLYKRNSGAFTQLSSQSTGVLGAGTTLKLTATGTTITFLVNGIAALTATDSTVTGGSPAIMASGTGRADNWAGGGTATGTGTTGSGDTGSGGTGGTTTTFSVSGSVSGLSGTLVLQDSNAGSLTITANGAFTFPTQLTTGTSYNATIQSSPATQTCTITNGAGTIGTANVTNITVTCTNITPPPPAPGSVSDDFNRADGPLGSSWTASADGGFTISGQAVVGTSDGISGAVRTGESYASNQFSQVQLTATQLSGSDQWIGPAVRLQNGGQVGFVGIYAWNSGSPQLQLFERNGTTWTQLGNSVSISPLAAGSTLKLMAVGPSLAFMVNGVEEIAAADDKFTGGAPGMMAVGTAHADNWSGGTASFEAHYLSTDSSGIASYDMISADDGGKPELLRVLQPSNPAQGVAHNFLFVLPVEPDLNSTVGDAMQVLQSLNAQNQYNLTIVEPTFSIDPWYADNPNDPSQQQETFMAAELAPWVKANLATTGTERSWLLGFSKSGIGGQDLILKHPDVFSLAASWDFPADASSYNQYGDSSAQVYGTNANFLANYQLSAAFLTARKAPFASCNRIWIGGYHAFQQDMTDYDALLTSVGIQHSTETPPTDMLHRWDSGWVPIALAALHTESLSQCA